MRLIGFLFFLLCCPKSHAGFIIDASLGEGPVLKYDADITLDEASSNTEPLRNEIPSEILNEFLRQTRSNASWVQMAKFYFYRDQLSQYVQDKYKSKNQVSGRQVLRKFEKISPSPSSHLAKLWTPTARTVTICVGLGGTYYFISYVMNNSWDWFVSPNPQDNLFPLGNTTRNVIDWIYPGTNNLFNGASYYLSGVITAIPFSYLGRWIWNGVPQTKGRSPLARAYVEEKKYLTDLEQIARGPLMLLQGFLRNIVKDTAKITVDEASPEQGIRERALFLVSGLKFMRESYPEYSHDSKMIKLAYDHDHFRIPFSKIRSPEFDRVLQEVLRQREDLTQTDIKQFYKKLIELWSKDLE